MEPPMPEEIIVNERGRWDNTGDASGAVIRGLEQRIDELEVFARGVLLDDEAYNKAPLGSWDDRRFREDVVRAAKTVLGLPLPDGPAQT